MDSCADGSVLCLRFFTLPAQIIANMTALAWRPEWQSLLANGTVNNPELNNLTGIVYGASVPRFCCCAPGY